MVQSTDVLLRFKAQLSDRRIFPDLVFDRVCFDLESNWLSSSAFTHYKVAIARGALDYAP